MRIYLIKIFFITFFLAIVARLFYWQLGKGDFLQAQAEGQHLTDLKVEALRGNIYFSDGSLLASSNPTFILFANPKVIASDKKTDLAYTLAKITALPQDVETVAKDFLNKLYQDLYWVTLKTNISLEERSKIEELKLPGVGFKQTSSRFYPEGSSSAHILGFVGSDARGDRVGYFGLEGFYEGELKGISGQLKLEKDANGNPIFLGGFDQSEAKNGKDLVLNIDRTVQFIVEDALKKGMEQYGAQAATAIVADPKTGAILGMASLPNYDPAKYSQFPSEFYKNPAVVASYEPGSTFKVLVMSAALNEDLVKVDTQCDICSGSILIGGFNIRTWNNEYFPNTSMKDVIIHSDNTGMVFVSRKLGLDKFYKYIQDFGIGQVTNIDLQEETTPDIRDKNDWREIDLATASFGQGLAVTPMQMIRAISAIANGGYLMEPHIVKFIKNDKGTFEIKPKIIRRVLKDSTAKVMAQIMVDAVEQGEAKWARLKGFKIAGKTGTAQIPVAGHYDPNKTIASFVGFAPADDPKFIMLIRYDQPTSSIFGAETAAPTFFEISKQLFNYYRIAPTE